MATTEKMPLWWSAFPWILALLVVLTGFFAWFGNMGNSFHIVSLYQVFPILGIWAWSIMWTHYINGEVRRLIPALPKHVAYHKASTVTVLALLLLHPGILAIEQFRQGKGIPPLSYFSYAGEASFWIIMLGIIGLTGFLFFEIIVRFQERPGVAKYWWLVNITQTVAMASIFFHALGIGGDLHGGWFRSYWIILGLLLAPCVLHTHISDLAGNRPTEND